MAEDRLHELDVNVSVETNLSTKDRKKYEQYQNIALCEKTRLIAIANGRFVDLYRIDTNAIHPFPFLQQISISTYINHVCASIFTNLNDTDPKLVKATCVAFPVPSFLLVGISVRVPESEMSKCEIVETKTLVLGLRLYATSVTPFPCGKFVDKSQYHEPSVQVSFSFVENVLGTFDKEIQHFCNFRRDMTPDAGSVLILLEDSNQFGVLSWKERFSDRQVCMAQVKQQAENLISAECDHNGQYVVLGGERGRLFLMSFRHFMLHESDVVLTHKQNAGQRLVLGPCSRSGVIVRDNPLELVRMVRTLSLTGVNCASTSLRWWSLEIRGQHKQLLLAGQQDGSLRILELIHEDEEFQCILDMRCIRIYPGLSSGTHDAVRSISMPKLCHEKDSKIVKFVVISDMRWRNWRVKITETGAESSCPIWPSVRESLEFQSIPLQIQDAKSIIWLSNSAHTSKLFSKALASSTPDYTYQNPIILIMTINRLQVVGLLRETVAENEKAVSSETDVGEEDVGATSEYKEEPGKLPIPKVNNNEESASNGPTTIQDKYKLPPMLWKAKTSTTPDSFAFDKNKDSKMSGSEDVSISKVSREEQTERIKSVIQRVETLDSILRSMRTSFQLFSFDVQRHMNFVSEQLEDKSFLQEQAELARFDAGEQPQHRRNETASPIIPHVAEKYDPDHPDADWAGFVRRSYKKRFYTNQSTGKDSLIYDEKGGLIPRIAERSTISGKKIFERQLHPSNEHLISDRDSNCSDWKTSYTSQTSMEATAKDDFVLGTRQNLQHKRHVMPMYEQDARNQLSENNRQGSPSLHDSGSSGLLSERRIDPRRSILAGIGKLVAAEDLNGIKPPPARHLSESYRNSSSKTLLPENYHATTIGYTGRRNIL
ncbi:uncharacterized protein PHALS_02264 [Plasmopara halstedii]|uniref:Uncharacterized protein n=1 Tax=Plasmopara halstedii TaxID=4781 RepID=A0A0N7L730_PLAHL|nr:uncharacterized protein PHALS_02264 [Plasmopara halstedii]CEG45931.1 hypothetical protein PHALS_02264 [Plasmopara halstedii]|eukprot:XP_024582300.1 hypothetical protein PHALS_02264 [Plasmopara halstedii]